MKYPQPLPLECTSSTDIEEDINWIKSEIRRSEDYTLSQKWVRRIECGSLEAASEGIFVLCKFHIEPSEDNVDKDLWIMVGDLPSAYFVMDNAPDVPSALNVYCDLMEEWCNSVKKGDIENAFPVDAEPTQENVDLLERRIVFLRKNHRRLSYPA